MDFLSRAEKVMRRIDELASVSEDPSCLTRTYGTTAFIQGRDLVAKWMREAGLEVHIDQVGNLRGRLTAADPGARTFVIGSHIDTVVNAGKYDGPLGVLTGLDLLETLVASRKHVPFHIELIAFCDEEGCRFHSTYLGSKAVAGMLEESLLDKCDAAGISLRDCIVNMGGDVKKLSKDALARDKWLGYFEMHIEQGPVLYERNLPVAVVTAIAGQRRVSLEFIGEAGHAGTVPMALRKDALAGMASFLVEAERRAIAANGAWLVTAGKLEIPQSASNVIPGRVLATLDIRSADEHTLQQAYLQLEELAAGMAKQRGLSVNWQCVQQATPVICDAGLCKQLEDAISYVNLEKLDLVSGAGHDAVALSAVTPVAMLFVRCYKGISHHPAEAIEAADLAAAIRVGDRFIEQLILRTEQ